MTVDLPSPNAPTRRLNHARSDSATARKVVSARARDQSIERDRPGAADQKEEEDGRPREVLGPRVRIHEQLDDRDHREQRQRGQPRRQSHDQQERAAQLERGGEGRRDLRREDRHLVLVAEERHRRLPARDLVEARTEEDAGDGQAEEELAHGERNALEPSRDHGEISKPTTIPSSSNVASARVRSKSASAASAASAESSSVRPEASAARNACSDFGVVRHTTSSPSRRISRQTPPAPRSSVAPGSAPGWFARLIPSTGHGEDRSVSEGSSRSVTLPSESGEICRNPSRSAARVSSACSAACIAHSSRATSGRYT